MDQKLRDEDWVVREDGNASLFAIVRKELEVKFCFCFLNGGTDCFFCEINWS